MKIVKFFKALLIKFKYWKRTGWNGHIVYHHMIKDYIIFCEKCHEYICDDGYCSNPFCPEEMRDFRS